MMMTSGMIDMADEIFVAGIIPPCILYTVDPDLMDAIIP